MTGARILGVGTCLPDKVITNFDLEKTLDTSNDWIVERTGISERRVGESTTQLGLKASQQALERSGVSAEELDLIIFATTTPDHLFPIGGCEIQDLIGASKAGAVDLNAACSGFMYALVAGYGYIGRGIGKVLVIGAETLSRIVDWDDRGTAILFGDGGGAVVLEATSDEEDTLLGWHTGSKGSLGSILACKDMTDTIHMDGREVFRQAVLAIEESVDVSLNRAGLTIDEIDSFVFHQANERIIDAACRRIGAETDKAVKVIGFTGNTSSASIPLAIDHGVANGAIKAGDTVLMAGFGAGMTYASAIIKWTS